MLIRSLRAYMSLIVAGTQSAKHAFRLTDRVHGDIFTRSQVAACLRLLLSCQSSLNASGQVPHFQLISAVDVTSSR